MSGILHMDTGQSCAAFVPVDAATPSPARGLIFFRFSVMRRKAMPGKPLTDTAIGTPYEAAASPGAARRCVSAYTLRPTRMCAMNIVRCFLVFLLLLGVPGQAMCRDTFPLVVNGTTLDIGAALERATLETALRSALPSEEPSLSTPERLQYDFQAVPDQGPVTLAFDFGAKGRFEGLGIDGYARESNPVAAGLASWLTATVGKGLRKGRDMTWKYAGFEFLLTETTDAGEDSMYGMFITRTAP